MTGCSEIKQGNILSRNSQTERVVLHRITFMVILPPAEIGTRHIQPLPKHVLSRYRVGNLSVVMDQWAACGQIHQMFSTGQSINDKENDFSAYGCESS